MWERIGPPLYYCEDCMLEVDVQAVEGAEPIIRRRCEHTGRIIAPRKAIVAGAGGLTPANKARMLLWQLAARLTGRTV